MFRTGSVIVISLVPGASLDGVAEGTGAARRGCASAFSRPAIVTAAQAAHTAIIPSANLNFTLTPTFELPHFAQTAARKIVTGYHPRLDATGQELLRAKGRLRDSGVACARVGYWKLP